jgi:hypothetical protein
VYLNLYQTLQIVLIWNNHHDLILVEEYHHKLSQRHRYYAVKLVDDSARFEHKDLSFRLYHHPCSQYSFVSLLHHQLLVYRNKGTK